MRVVQGLWIHDRPLSKYQFVTRILQLKFNGGLSFTKVEALSPNSNPTKPDKHDKPGLHTLILRSIKEQCIAPSQVNIETLDRQLSTEVPIGLCITISLRISYLLSHEVMVVAHPMLVVSDCRWDLRLRRYL